MPLQVLDSPVLWQIPSFKRFDKSKTLEKKEIYPWQAGYFCTEKAQQQETQVIVAACTWWGLLQRSRTKPGCRILRFWKTEHRTPRDYHRVFLWWLPAAVVTPLVLISCWNAKGFPLGRFTPSFLFICVLRFPSLTLSEYTNYLMSWRLYRST